MPKFGVLYVAAIYENEIGVVVTKECYYSNSTEKIISFYFYPRKRFHELNKSEWYNRKVYSKHCDEEGDCKTIDYVSLKYFQIVGEIYTCMLIIYS